MFTDVTVGCIAAKCANMIWNFGIASRWFNELWLECIRIHHRAGAVELGIAFGIAFLIGCLLLRGSFF